MSETRDSRRRLLAALVAAGVLSPVAAIRAVLAAGDLPGVPGINKVRGAVKVNGRPAAVGTPVKLGDTIETGADGFTIFIVSRDAYLLRESSKLELSGSGVAAQVLRLITGKLLSVYAKGQRQVVTQTATIGIRGSGAYLESYPDRTYICLCYGIGELVPNADPAAAETVQTSHHDQPRWVHARGAPRMVEPAPMMNHSDSELELLESVVGRVPPFAADPLRSRY